MDEYLKCECSHCGQPIEYPAAGTGETVPCPTCSGPVYLTPSEPPESEILAPPVVSPPPAPAAVVSKPTNPPPELKPFEPPAANPFDRGLLEFARDVEFEKHPPTRDQVARAWALAAYRKPDPDGTPATANSLRPCGKFSGNTAGAGRLRVVRVRTKPA